MENNKTYVAIMAGGIGSRFWPASRERRPKQFLDILGLGKSLIRLTYERFLPLCPPENILIVTNIKYKKLVKEHLPEIADEQILCEPSRNNTAPCIAYTAFRIQNIAPAANLIIAPSDHIITNEVGFIHNLKTAVNFASEKDVLLTLGIRPSRPDTGYGYINYEPSQNGVCKVKDFKEKPNLETAQEYLDSGDYLWNAGIFIWNVQNLLAAFEKYTPEIYELLEQGKDYYNTPQEQDFINEYYPKTPSISIDYAIMEKADNIYTIPSEFGWSDLGTWASLYAESEKDVHQNVITSKNVLLSDTTNSIIRVPPNKLVVLHGLDDYIVVDEDDVLLVYPKSAEQKIKLITTKVKELNQNFL